MRPRRILAALLLTPFLAAPLAATAQDRYIFLGDSLVDNHNSFDLSTPVFGFTTPASPPYFDGRFSNGPNWTDKLDGNQVFYSNYFLSDPNCDDSTYADTNACGSLTDPGVLPNTSLGFAIGGSRAGTEALGVTGGPGMLTVLDDLATYVNQGRVAGTGNATFAFITGGNDYTGYLGAPGTTTPAESVAETLDEIGQAIDKIAALGAQRVLVFNIFDLGQVPNVAGTFGTAAPSELSTLHNAGLPGLLAAKRQSTGLEIVLIDLDALYKDIFARPAFYGFTNTTTGCIDSTTTLATGDCPTAASEAQTLFWDGQHPTTVAHGYIQELLTATLTAVESGAAVLRPLPETQLITNRTLLAAARGQLAQWHAGAVSFPRTRTAVALSGDEMEIGEGSAPVAGFTPREWRSGTASGVGAGRVFIAGARRDGISPRTDGANRYKFDSDAALVGVEMMMSETLFAGVHFGYTTGESDVDGGGGNESEAYVAGLHGGWRRDALSVTAQVNVARVDVEKIERPTGFSLLPTATGKTDGWLAAGEIEARYAWSVPELGTVAPLLRLGGSTTRLDSYQERGAGFMNLSVDRTSVSEVSAGVGITGSREFEMSWGWLSPQLSVVVERQIKRDVDAVGARLSSGQELTALPDTRERNSITFGGSLGLDLRNGVSVDLSVSTQRGEDGSRLHVLPEIRVSTRF